MAKFQSTEGIQSLFENRTACAFGNTEPSRSHSLKQLLFKSLLRGEFRTVNYKIPASGIQSNHTSPDKVSSKQYT